ncbi:hypothetical protein SCLCIDRAFT_27786 [Scleroderma citrinum Foug A]|uniref:Uncharacterized protein n=1 Tax=Scleroderma citrinum Foug A TaxID=1036808 RepID=A0A0C3DRD8_9AGAM|nr:hypothetical protein SCLCIDRAFT_27786 [Scleroderma citrinum Foug A]
MDKNFYSPIPPLYVPCTLHHHPPPLRHPPSQWHQSVAIKRATVFLPTFSAVIQFAPVTCDCYLMDKNYYGYPSPSSVLEACQDSTKERKDYGPIPPPLRATHSTSSPASSASPPSQWHQPVAVKRVTVFLPAFSAVIQFASVTLDERAQKDYGLTPPLRATHSTSSPASSASPPS